MFSVVQAEQGLEDFRQHVITSVHLTVSLQLSHGENLNSNRED